MKDRPLKWILIVTTSGSFQDISVTKLDSFLQTVHIPASLTYWTEGGLPDEAQYSGTVVVDAGLTVICGLEEIIRIDKGIHRIRIEIPGWLHIKREIPNELELALNGLPKDRITERAIQLARHTTYGL